MANLYYVDQNGVKHALPVRGAVSSVNGKTGVVNLTASDVNAPTQAEHDTLATRVTALENKYKVITVTCVTQDSVLVTGQTVTVRQGNSEASPIFQTASYNGQPVTFEVPIHFPYYISVTSTLTGHFNPTTATGNADSDTTVKLTYNDISHVSTFSDVEEAVAAGARDILVGTEIADTYTNDSDETYSDPWICVSVEQVQDENDEWHWAAIMQRKYVNEYDMQFDAVEQVVATGTYEANKYYYMNDGGTYKLLVEGTDYNVGDTISGTVWWNEVKDTTARIAQSGYNRYRDSGYRQWLTSDADKGQWWTSTHGGDVAHSQLRWRRGYLAGCSQMVKDHARKTRITCYTNNVTDNSVVDVMYDKLWLPSGTQMYGSVNDNEGTYWKYWKDVTGLTSPSNSANDYRIIYDVKAHTAACSYRLRSASRTDSCSAWRVNGAGSLYGTYGANTSFRSCPACAIWKSN